jgi:XTP/dITP diphosphohydrolase
VRKARGTGKGGGTRPAPAFVTSNPHKFAEAERILKQFGVIIRHAKLSCTEARGEQPALIAADSARSLEGRLKAPFFVEDSGLFIRSLNGFPGAYSAWALEKIGLDGMLRLMRGEPDRRAAFRTAVALFDGRSVIVFEGEAKGTLASGQRGSGGFGYDPIFLPAGRRKSFAELNPLEKDALSSRGKALSKLARHLRKG